VILAPIAGQFTAPGKEDEIVGAVPLFDHVQAFLESAIGFGFGSKMSRNRLRKSPMIFTPTLKQRSVAKRLVVPREALKPRYEQWTNTSADYLIRARTNIGLEWNLGLVTEALKKEGARKGNNSHVGETVASIIKTLQNQREETKQGIEQKTD
jgi:hypothetical protein